MLGINALAGAEGLLNCGQAGDGILGPKGSCIHATNACTEECLLNAERVGEQISRQGMHEHIIDSRQRCGRGLWVCAVVLVAGVIATDCAHGKAGVCGASARPGGLAGRPRPAKRPTDRFRHGSSGRAHASAPRTGTAPRHPSGPKTFQTRKRYDRILVDAAIRELKRGPWPRPARTPRLGGR